MASCVRNSLSANRFGTRARSSAHSRGWTCGGHQCSGGSFSTTPATATTAVIAIAAGVRNPPTSLRRNPAASTNGTDPYAKAPLTNATFQNSAEPAIEDKWLPQVPRVSGSVWATIQLPYDLQAAVIWHSLSHQFDDDRNNFKLEPSSQIDLKLSGRRGRMGWYLAFTNMFDNRIEVGRTPLVTLAPGTEVRLGASWQVR